MPAIAVIALVFSTMLLATAVRTKTWLAVVAGLAAAGSATAGLIGGGSELVGLALAGLFLGCGLLIGGQVLQRLLSQVPNDHSPGAQARERD